MFIEFESLENDFYIIKKIVRVDKREELIGKSVRVCEIFGELMRWEIEMKWFKRYNI